MGVPVADRAIWGDADRIDRQAKSYRAEGQAEALERLALSVPLADAVRLAKRFAGRRRTGLPKQDPVIARLAAADEGVVAWVAADAARQSSSTHEFVVDSPQWLSFGIGDPVVTLTLYEPPGVTRIAMLRDGKWSDVYRGTLEHLAVVCIDADNVIAVREDPDDSYALVHYNFASGETRRAVTGHAVAALRPAATRDGFVAGSLLQPSVVVARPEAPIDVVDLRPLGLESTRAVAVDPTGEAVAFGGGDRILVTDCRVTHPLGRCDRPVPNAPLAEIVFTGPSRLVATGADGGLSLWRWVAEREALELETAAAAPRLSGLVSIPAWGVVGGRHDAEGEYRFFDPATLAPTDPPRWFLEAGYRPGFVHAVAAPPSGRFAAVGGYLTGKPAAKSHDPALVLHDFDHPLARILRPIASLDDGDVDAIAYAAGDVRRRSAQERMALELLRAAAEHVLGGAASA
jgi:hypothetical protein